MAFQFVVETGFGDPDANSFVSVAFADTYIEMNAFASLQWSLLSLEDKERLLARASFLIAKRVKWNGTRVDRESGLPFPRAGLHDEDGFIIPDNEIPQALMEATCEFACYLMSSDWSNTSTQSGGLTKIKVDVIELEMSDSAASSSSRAPFPEIVLDLLDHLGSVATTGGATAFKKIIRH